ncbi:MAG: diguanylate cyclase [Gammaproteobacteria bacterium]|nr:diguanylate cyclase [Gammaproteobacteria bacterium]
MLNSHPRILIADDSPTQRLALRRALNGFPAELVEMRNGAEVLGAARDEEFALILLDLQMPELDGFETIRRLRQLPTAQTTPVIIITAAYTDAEHRRLGYDLGAADYLTNKPIEPEILRQKVRVFLDLYHKRLELQAAVARYRYENERLFSENERYRSHSDQLAYRASHDPLTGLPNRLLLEDRLQAAIYRSRRSRRAFAVAFLDLDRFKSVNDRYGHAAGDELLTEVAQRLMASVRASDTVARIGGDEFVLILEGVGDDADAREVGVKILQQLRRPAQLHKIPEGNAVMLEPAASFGLALHPQDAADAEGLLMLADLAMYQAKRSGGTSVCSYRSLCAGDVSGA